CMTPLIARLAGHRPVITRPTARQTIMSVTEHASRRRRLAAFLVGAALVLPVAVAVTSARASLTPGTGWTAVTLPTNYAIADGSNCRALSPASCAAGKHFCPVMAGHSRVNGPSGTAALA